MKKEVIRNGNVRKCRVCKTSTMLPISTISDWNGKLTETWECSSCGEKETLVLKLGVDVETVI